MTDAWSCGHHGGAMCAECYRVLAAHAHQQAEALLFVAELAQEELIFAKVGTGAEVALRHIARRARETLASATMPPDRTAEEGTTCPTSD